MKGWKLLFNIWGVVCVLTIASGLAAGSVDIFNIAILGLGLTGLYGLAFNKPIWTQRFWRIFTIALFALMAVILVVVLASMGFGLSTTEPGSGNSLQLEAWNIVLGVIYLALYFLQMYGLYLYAFKRDELWQQIPHSDD